MADDSQVAEKVLIIGSQFHIVVFVLDFLSKQAQDALDYDRDDLIFDQVVLDFQSLRRMHSCDIVHDLQVFRPNIAHLPVGRRA